MTFAPTLRLLLRRWLVIGLVTLIAGAAVYAVSSTRRPQYTATTAQYFTVGIGASAADLAQGSNYLQDQMASYGELATSPAVLNPVIDELALPLTVRQLARAVEVVTPRGTVVLQISVTRPDPQQAADIANAIGSQLTSTVDSVGSKLPNGRSLVSVQSIQTALPPTIQSSPDTRRNTALGLLIGLMLACSAVLLRARLADHVAAPSALAELTDRPVLGTVRRAGPLGKRGLVVLSEPRSRSAEDIRRLRASIEHLAAGRASLVLAVTSSIRREGRTTIAANLAAALGEVGYRCVLVDADLRQPQVAEVTGTDVGEGLPAALREPGELSASLVRSGRGAFDVLGVGGPTANPTELLASDALPALVTELRRRYTYVVVDTPALLAVSDAAALRQVVDGALMVVDATSVKRGQLTSALQSAAHSGLEVVGIAHNQVDAHALPAAKGYGERQQANAWS